MVTWATGTDVTWPAAPRKRPLCSAGGVAKCLAPNQGPRFWFPPLPCKLLILPGLPV